MNRHGPAFAALLMAPTAALACSCIATGDPAELKRLAAESAPNALAVVEAEALTAFQPATGSGERMRVVRTLAGQAPATFTIERGPTPSSASCDILYSVGQRTLLILYPARGSAGAVTYAVSGLCTEHLLEKPEFRDALIDAIAGRGERG